MELEDRIIKQMPELSDGQKLIASWILQDRETAAFLTAAALGRRVGVSESTVVRFATALGYSGYPELQRNLQEMLVNKISTVQRLAGSVDDANSSVQDGPLFQRVMHTDMENIALTVKNISADTFDEAVAALCSARRIYVVGFRSASSLAYFLGFCLSWVLKNVTIMGNCGFSSLEPIADSGPEDVVIGISFPRYTRQTVSFVDLARKNGSKIIAITDGVLSPLATRADILLTAKTSMASFVDSFVAPLSLINALVAAVGVRKRDEVTKALRDLERVWEEHGIYERPAQRDV